MPSRRERKKQDTRARILTAGLALFETKGFDGCTIDDIAAAADVGKGTIYNYVRTKDDIVVGFVVDVERDIQREVSKLALGRGSLESILTRFIQVQFDRKAPHHPFVRIFLARLSGQATGQSAWVHEVQAVLDPPISRVFSSLSKRGLLRPDVDVGTAIGAFKVMHLGLTVVWALEGPPWANMPHVTRAQIRLFCSGVEAR
jgi:AcrR family transcriptional regulator